MKKVQKIFCHLFIPKESNNYRARVLHHDFLTYYLLVAFFLVFSVKGLSSFSQVLGFATDITVEKLYQLTNREREQRSLSALTYNELLSKAAHHKAQDMFNKNYWAHYGPDGTTPWNLILQEGYQYEYAGENLAKNFLFSEGVIQGWMDSKTHKENILRSEYSDVGFAIVHGILNGEQTTLVVQILAKPLLSKATTNKTVSIPMKQPYENSSPQRANTVLGQKNINFGAFPFHVDIIFLTILLCILILDFYVAAKLHVLRITGKNIAHIIFIAFIIMGLLLMAKGAIL